MTPDKLSGAQISRESVASHMAFVDRFKATQEAGNKAANAIAAAAQNASDSVIEEPTVAFIRMTKRLEKDDSKSTKKTSTKTDVAEGEEGVEEVVLVSKDDAGDLAQEFSQQDDNLDYHLNTEKLSELAVQRLGSKINEDSTPQEIVETVKAFLRENNQDVDVAYVQKALDFLVKVTQVKVSQAGEGASKDRLAVILNRVERARDAHYEANSVDIQVTQKIIGVVDVVSTEPGMLSVKETLDIYRGRIKEPKTVNQLFEYYQSQKGGLKDMKHDAKGFNRFMGANFKRENIETPEILQLMDANKTMWALFGLLKESKEKVETAENFLLHNEILES